VPACALSLSPQLRLNAQQLDEKRAAESAVEEIRELLDAATSEESKDQLGEELKARQGKLDDLLAGFEVRGVWVCVGCVFGGKGGVRQKMGQETTQQCLACNAHAAHVCLHMLRPTLPCPAHLQKLALEAAKSGEFVRPSERRRQHMLETQGSGNGMPGMGGGTGDPYRWVRGDEWGCCLTGETGRQGLGRKAADGILAEKLQAQLPSRPSATVCVALCVL
jgi:hypothetical protein